MTPRWKKEQIPLRHPPENCGCLVATCLSYRGDTSKLLESDVTAYTLVVPHASANAEMKAFMKDKRQIAINTITRVTSPSGR